MCRPAHLLARFLVADMCYPKVHQWFESFDRFTCLDLKIRNRASDLKEIWRRSIHFYMTKFTIRDCGLLNLTNLAFQVPIMEAWSYTGQVISK